MRGQARRVFGTGRIGFRRVSGTLRTTMEEVKAEQEEEKALARKRSPPSGSPCPCTTRG